MRTEGSRFQFAARLPELFVDASDEIPGSPREGQRLSMPISLIGGCRLLVTFQVRQEAVDHAEAVRSQHLLDCEAGASFICEVGRSDAG